MTRRLPPPVLAPVLPLVLLALACGGDGTPSDPGGADVPAEVPADVPGDLPPDAADPGPGDVPADPGPGIVQLVVAFEPYAGHWDALDKATVFLYRNRGDGTPDCADLPPGDTATTASEKKGPLDLGSSAQFATLGLAAGETATFTVRCFGSIGTGPFRAYGCLDDVPVTGGTPASARCALQDLPVRLSGTYGVASTFDLVADLPADAKAALDRTEEAWTRPLPTVLGLLCDPAVAVEDTPARRLCEAVFQDPGKPDPKNLTQVGQVVSTRMQAHLESLLNYACTGDAEPPDCPSLDPALFGTDTAWPGWRRLGLDSELACTQEPGADGKVPAGACTESWKTLRVGGLPDPSCPAGARWCKEQLASLPLGSALGAAPAATPEVALDDEWRLSVAPHALPLGYGALLDHALEKMLLPALFGDGKDGKPAVDSWEALVASALSGRDCLQLDDCCESFGKALAAGAPGVLAGVAEAACDAWVASGAAVIRARFDALDTVASPLVLGTPAGSPCALDDGDGDQRFDALGSAQAPCFWAATWDLGGRSFTPDATFTGARQ